MASVFMGQETNGLDRIAGFFYDGIFIRYAMVVDGQVVVFDTYGVPLYTERGVRLPRGFVPKSIQSLRSRQSGKLVVCLGGFFEGTRTQCGCVVATDYVIQE